MSGLRPIIDGAVAAFIAEHPKYFTERGLEKAQTAITRKIMAALMRSDGDGAEAAPAAVETVELVPLAVDPKSREGRAYINLRALAGASAPFKMGDGSISLPVEAQKPAVYALADMPSPPAEIITARAQIGAWMEFLAGSLPAGIARKSIQFDHNGQPAILMPWPWPPGVTGKIYTAEEAQPE